jgi:polyhydroxyalkanoate synthesis regulator phasin
MTEPGSNVKTAVGAGALLALLASNIYLFVQVHDIKADAAKQQEATAAQIQDLRENTTSLAATSRKHYQSLSQDLDKRSREAVRAASTVKSEALSRIEQSRKALEEQQQQAAERISGDLNTVKQAADAKFTEVTTDVGNVKTQVASTQTELQRTIGDLKKVQGDLGVTSGYVATNGKELAALKRMGERNYFEFTIGKNKQPQKVGDIQVSLKKTDPKRNKFTVEVMADDKKIEKRDKTANEPVQFYVAKARQPYEIVVNEVRKDQIVGYLATPKDLVPRASSN